MLNGYMLSSARRVVFVALLASAALSANAFAIKTISFFSADEVGDTSDGPGVLCTLPKFNPNWGTLLQADVSTVAVSGYDFLVANTNKSGAEDVKYTVDSWALVRVGTEAGSEAAISSNLVGASFSEVTASGEDPALPATDSITGDNSVSDGPDFTYTGPGLLDFTSAPGDSELGVFQQFFNHGRFQGANINQESFFFSESQAEVTYTYAGVPAPAAAGTMVIGFIGTFARRRKA